MKETDKDKLVRLRSLRDWTRSNGVDAKWIHIRREDLDWLVEQVEKHASQV